MCTGDAGVRRGPAIRAFPWTATNGWRATSTLARRRSCAGPGGGLSRVGGGEEDMPPTVEDLGRGDGADDISDVDSEELNQRVQEAETACGHACSPAEAGSS